MTRRVASGPIGVKVKRSALIFWLGLGAGLALSVGPVSAQDQTQARTALGALHSTQPMSFTMPEVMRVYESRRFDEAIQMLLSIAQSDSSATKESAQSPAQQAELSRRALMKIQAQNLLGHMHEHGIGVDADPHAALDWYAASARAGSRVGMERLGYFHEKGLGVAQDAGVARRWYEKAIEYDHTPALMGLARLTRDGAGIERDLDQAKSLFLTAAQTGEKETAQGYFEAAVIALGQLGSVDAERRSSVRDEALQWLEQAARSEVHQALEWLSDIYMRGGYGIEPDPARAVTYYEKLGQMGDAQAFFELGQMYERSAMNEDGSLDAASLARAFEFYRQAAGQGHYQSMWGLGRMHATGKGAPYSLPNAYMWFDIASDVGGQEMINLRDAVAREMSRSELDRAIKITQACRQARFMVCG